MKIIINNTIRTLLFTVLLTNFLFSQENEIQLSLKRLTALDSQIRKTERIVRLAESNEIEIKVGISDDGKSIDLEELNKVSNDISQLNNAKLSFDKDSISIDGLGVFKKELINQSRQTEYEKLYSDYDKYQIDYRFYNNELLNGTSAVRNFDGFFVTAKNGQYYHIIVNAEYWTPTEIIGTIKEPFSDKRIQSILCVDATKLYSDEWNAYIKTRDNKYERQKRVSVFIRQYIVPSINRVLTDKRQQIELPISILAIRLIKWRDEYKTIVNRLVTFGVSLPSRQESNLDEVQKAANKYSSILNSLYDSFFQQRNSGSWSKGIYSLLKLITIDKAKVIKNAMNDLQSIRSNLTSNSFDAIVPCFIKTLESSSISSNPLNGQQFFEFLGLFDNRYLISSMLNSNSDTNKLAVGLLDAKQLYEVFKQYGYDIPSVKEIEQFLKVDNNTLVNVFNRQVGKNDISLMTTDSRGITGLVAGDILLLLDESGKPKYFHVQTKSEIAWGMTQVKLALQEADISILNNPFINIHLKKGNQ